METASVWKISAMITILAVGVCSLSKTLLLMGPKSKHSRWQRQTLRQCEAIGKPNPWLMVIQQLHLLALVKELLTSTRLVMENLEVQCRKAMQVEHPVPCSLSRHSHAVLLTLQALICSTAGNTSCKKMQSFGRKMRLAKRTATHDSRKTLAWNITWSLISAQKRTILSCQDKQFLQDQDASLPVSPSQPPLQWPSEFNLAIVGRAAVSSWWTTTRISYLNKCSRKDLFNNLYFFLLRISA